MFKLKFDINLPSIYNEKIVEKYLTMFSLNEEIIGYSLNEELEIVKGKGLIKYSEEINYHKNLDEGENRLFFKIDNIKNDSMSRNSWQVKWWTPSLEEIKKIQKENIEQNKKLIQEELDKIDLLSKTTII